jgi:hypothetical protein
MSASARHPSPAPLLKLPACRLTHLLAASLPSPRANSFIIRTSEKRACNPCRIRTSKTKHLEPIRMNTYRKPPGGRRLVMVNLPVAQALLPVRFVYLPLAVPSSPLPLRPRDTEHRSPLLCAAPRTPRLCVIFFPPVLLSPPNSFISNAYKKPGGVVSTSRCLFLHGSRTTVHAPRRSMLSSVGTG